MPWINSDGLVVKIGPEEATIGKGGEYEFDGPQRQVEFTLNFGDFGSADAAVEYNVTIPKGAFIERVQLEVFTALTSGGAATVNVGGVRTSDAVTLDATGGFVNALAITALNTAGKFVELINGSTGAGTYIGTTLVNNVYLSTKWGTAALTAGKLGVRIWYSFPA